MQWIAIVRRSDGVYQENLGSAVSVEEISRNWQRSHDQARVTLLAIVRKEEKAEVAEALQKETEE